MKKRLVTIIIIILVKKLVTYGPHNYHRERKK